MQFGFVIDHTRCIGCHACTVACKAENDVPVGKFRTWVKYTESGKFPEVKRSFAVLRCNQCTDAPCVTICPVHALHKRPDGIVDIDPARCIGCKGCMQACPYDALHINDDTGIAQKCHFCAHRVERNLAPACAVVCPTEAIIPGDFHDPESQVSILKLAGDLTARKEEAGTRPNVWYRDAHPDGLEPLATTHAGGYLWAERLPGVQMDAQAWDALESKANEGLAPTGPGAARERGRTVYDVAHAPLWGGKVTGYLFTKSLAAGSFLAAGLLLPPFNLFGAFPTGTAGIQAFWVTLASAFVFLIATSVLLITDLKRPERFWYILRYAQWNSWLARGTLALTAYGALLSAWLVAAIAFPVGGGRSPDSSLLSVLNLLTLLAAAATAAYTAWLFHQAKGRVLWMRRGLAPLLLFHALLGGAAILLAAGVLFGWTTNALAPIRILLAIGLVGSGLLTLAEGRMAPKGREAEYARVVRLVTHGPFRRKRWVGAIAIGIVLPLLLLLVPMPLLWLAAAVSALIGLWVEEDLLVRAGQALPIS